LKRSSHAKTSRRQSRSGRGSNGATRQASIKASC
jgi:hypothetical protein